MKEWVVTVCFGNSAPIIECFKEEAKARDFYTDSLLRYPTANVELIKPAI